MQGKEKLMIDINRPKLINCTKHTNLQIAGFPYRHHSPSLKNRVSLLNIVIENLVTNATQASFWTINDLTRHMYIYPKHGLHFFPWQLKWRPPYAGMFKIYNTVLYCVWKSVVHWIHFLLRLHFLLSFRNSDMTWVVQRSGCRHSEIRFCFVCVV